MQNLFFLITLSAALVLANSKDSSSIQTVDSASSSKIAQKLVQNFLNQFNADWKKGNAKQVALKYYDEHIAFINEADNSVTYATAIAIDEERIALLFVFFQQFRLFPFLEGI
uniref:Uncharacterized protein n=1 Tax=Ditylenchus dipsaci TaxID=166011 RepID=A0A915ECQ9_9BILA